MKTTLAILTLFASALLGSAGLALAAVGSDALLLAQTQTQNKAQPQKKVAVTPKIEKPIAGCMMDSRMSPGGEYWCKRKSLYQCNATTGTWIGTGKNCTSQGE